MTREKKKAPAPRTGVRVLTRRAKLERAQQQQQHDDTWRTLNPLKAPPKVKHRTTFELVRNTDKKKRLEYEITTNRHPPPGFEFVPVGHPDLSQLCKDMSRDQDAMIFIVSEGKNPDNLEHHMNRVGYHFRQMIVDQARSQLPPTPKSTKTDQPGKPEPIPEKQAEINAQADKVLKDLFPRIPNTDRHEIINHAFRKDGTFRGEARVGMVKELTLARRVQLAALAHIRHTHTRYDQLLKQSSWGNARKAVEKPCLDIIVKWRGDEETGRDQLDEILREVIEISDTEEESDDETSVPEPAPARRVSTLPTGMLTGYAQGSIQTGSASRLPSQAPRRDLSVPSVPTPTRQKAIAKAEKRTARKTQRFRRYAAAAEALAGSAEHRNHAEDPSIIPFGAAPPMDVTRTPGTVYPINRSREPTVVAARETPNYEQMSRRFELRPDSQFHNGSRREGIPSVPHGPFEANGYASSRLAYNDLDSYVPKVGRAPASYTHPHVPISPARRGLQDLVIESIEPASPIPSREPLEANYTSHREPPQFTEMPRVTPRAIYEPADSGSVPWPVSNGEGLAARHRYGAEYPGSSDVQPRSSFLPAGRPYHGEDPRWGPAEQLAERSVSSFKAVDARLPRNHSRAVPYERVKHYGSDVHTRTRANPLVIEDDGLPLTRQASGMRRHPDGDYLIPSVRQREEVPHLPVREDVRMQDGPRLIYIEDSPTRPRSAFDYHTPINPPHRELPLYQDTIPIGRPRRHFVDGPPEYMPSHRRDPLHGQSTVHEPAGWPSNAPQDLRTAPRGPDRTEVRYENGPPHFRERLDFIPVPSPHQDQREVSYYRIREVNHPMAPQIEYRHEHQPLHAPLPINRHHIDSYESPVLYHTSNYHHMVPVDH
ncbi:hypothetical protein M426DRAFT_319873 [Hypoxylon sp. CI-4A]|nr:hypothetical protein M426DRAFT_319873 [Hypoxylon sp. CI-4A]